MPSAERACAAQRARGQAHLTVGRRDDRTVLGDLRMSGSSKLLFPRGSGRGSRLGMDAVLLNSAGGVTGGDRFDLALHLAPKTDLRVTTQAAERIYRALPGTVGRIETQARLAQGARLAWLPQETLVFEGAGLERHLRFDLAADSQLLASEVLVFGREAMGEELRNVVLRDRIDVRREGRLVFCDRLRLDGDCAGLLDHEAVGGQARAMASVIMAGPGAAARVEALRALLPETGGISALDDDLVFMRLLGRDSLALRSVLIPLLTEIARDTLPRPWML